MTNTESPTTTKTAEGHGAEDADSVISDAEISNPLDFDARALANEILASNGKDADEALIDALGWSGVADLAGLTHDDSEEPSADLLAWCERYSAGYAARLAEIAADEAA